MLFVAGLGLDISLDEKVLRWASISEEVWLDNYTVIMPSAKPLLEKALSRAVHLASRDELESDVLLRAAEGKNILLLTIGDPFFATTHATLYIEALKRGVPIKVHHNASILNVMGRLGLSPYRFGAVVTLPKWLPNYKPTSSFERLMKNLSCDLHTLMLVDISDGQPMHIDEAFSTAEKIEAVMGGAVISSRELFILSRAGLEDEKILFGPWEELKRLSSMVKEPFSFVIPASLRGFEEEAADFWRTATRQLKI